MTWHLLLVSVALGALILAIVAVIAATAFVIWAVARRRDAPPAVGYGAHPYASPDVPSSVWHAAPPTAPAPYPAPYPAPTPDPSGPPAPGGVTGWHGSADQGGGWTGGESSASGGSDSGGGPGDSGGSSGGSSD